MKLVKPTYELINQGYNNDLLIDMFKHIEICGRNCYKSEDRITDDSYIKFVHNLEKSNHGAMLEHGTIYLTIPLETLIDDPQYMLKMDIVKFFQTNKYSKVKSEVINKPIDIEIEGFGVHKQASVTFYYITTNYRVIYENRNKEFKMALENFKSDKITLDHLYKQFMVKPTKYHEKRYTVKFTCDIGVSREFNRHRTHSIAEESTRYCNYSKDKSNNQINVCFPAWFTDNDKEILEFADKDRHFRKMCNDIGENNKKIYDALDYWVFANKACEYTYMNLIKLGWTPQQARTVLPLDTKTTLIHTAFESDWKHFINLRSKGTTGAPHPSAKELAEPLEKTLEKIN